MPISSRVLGIVIARPTSVLRITLIACVLGIPYISSVNFEFVASMVRGGVLGRGLGVGFGGG
jgi:hypothetical protein